MPKILVCHTLFTFVSVRNIMNRMAINVGGLVGTSLTVVYVTLNITVPGMFFHHFVTSGHGHQLLGVLIREGGGGNRFISLRRIRVGWSYFSSLASCEVCLVVLPRDETGWGGDFVFTHTVVELIGGKG